MPFLHGADSSRLGLSPIWSLLIPEAHLEHLARAAMNKLNGEAFEGVTVWHCSSYRLLKLLVAGRHAGGSLQLVCSQGGVEEVAQVIIPHTGETKILGGCGIDEGWLKFLKLY